MTTPPTPTPQEEVIGLLRDALAIRGSNVPRSLEMALEALAKAQRIEDKHLIARSLNDVAFFYMIVGQNERSLQTSREALAQFTELGDEMGIADARFNIGSVYYKTDNYHAGLMNQVDALAVYERHKAHDKVSRVYKNLGTIYEYLGDAHNAVTSYDHAVEAAKLAGDLNLESNAYNPLSGIHLNEGDADRAMELIERSIAMKTQTQDIRGLAFALYGRGKVHAYNRNFAEAERDYLDSLRIHMEMGEKLGLTMTYYKLGVLYRIMGRLPEAVTVLQQGCECCETYKVMQFKYKCHLELYKVYKELGDTELALEQLEAHIAAKDTVINLETFKVIENYEHIVRRKEDENRELLQAKELVESQNQALVKANAELDQYVYRASHDLRAPISSIMGLAGIGMNTDDLDEARRCFEMISKRVQAQDHFIRQIVENAKNARLPLAQEDISIRQIVAEVAEGLFFMEGIGEVEIEVEAPEGFRVRSDAMRLRSILTNLIRNAIQYRDMGKAQPFVRIEAHREESRCILTVTDNGQGIPPDRMDKVFNMFYRGNERSLGSGLGLFIVQETVATLGGSISFTSELGVGSSFRVELPGG